MLTPTLPEDLGNARGQLRHLGYELAKPLQALPGEGRLQTLAVLAFTETGPESKKRELGKLVSAELATVLKRDHALNLVERERIDAALQEASLNELGLVDEKTAVKLGELLGAQALVIGTVSDAGDQFLVNARIVNTGNGAVFTTAQTSVPAGGLLTYANEAVVLRTRSGAVFRSLLLPGWGQFYNRQEPKGWVLITITAAFVLTAVGLHLGGATTHGRYLGEANAGLQEQLLRTEGDLYVARNAAIYLTAGVWAFNVIDAFINGKTYDPARGGD